MRLPPNYAFETMRTRAEGGMVIRSYKEYLDARTWREQKIKDNRVNLDEMYVVKWVDNTGHFGILYPGDYVWV